MHLHVPVQISNYRNWARLQDVQLVADIEQVRQVDEQGKQTGCPKPFVDS